MGQGQPIESIDTPYTDGPWVAHGGHGELEAEHDYLRAFRGQTDAYRVPRREEGNTGHAIQSQITRIDFPKYSGEEEPSEWVFNTEQFFHYHHTPDEKVLLASFHLTKITSQWFQWWQRTQRWVTWRDMAHALCGRFGPTEYEDFDEALYHIR